MNKCKSFRKLSLTLQLNKRCSKVRDNHLYKKFWLVMLTIFATAKNFATLCRNYNLNTFIKQLNRYTKSQPQALQLQPLLRTIMILSHGRASSQVARSLSLVLVI